MTTIAFRSGILAADTASTVGTHIVRRDVPKIVAHHGCLAGASGTATYAAAFLRWFQTDQKGEPPEAKSENGDRGMIVRLDGTLELYESGGWFPAASPYFAIGSGAEIALGAMFAGASAEEAVKASIEHDPFTGGNITVLKLETAP